MKKINNPTSAKFEDESEFFDHIKKKKCKGRPLSFFRHRDPEKKLTGSSAHLE